MLIFLYSTWGNSTSSSNYTREESGPQNRAFTIDSAPDKLLHLHQQISIAVSSPPALGSFHTVGLEHLLLPGFFPLNRVFAIY